MKRLKFISAALTVALAAVACGNNGSYTIKGQLEASDEYLYDSVALEINGVRNAVAVEQNQFVLEGQIDTPTFTEILISYISPEDGSLLGSTNIPVVVESGKINVALAADESFTIGGTKCNDAIQALNDAATEWEEREGEWSEIEALVKEFVAEQSQTQAGVYGITMAQNVLGDTDMIEALKGCDESVKQHPNVAKIAERMEVVERTSKGQPFVDFEIETTDGIVKLSDYVGKGNVVLVDFWASWCGPCRREIPNVKAAYDEYKDKGFVVVGVPTNDAPENTLSALQEEGVDFPQMLGVERQVIGARAYGVRSIPTMVLFDADGTILGRSNSVDALSEELAEALK